VTLGDIGSGQSAAARAAPCGCRAPKSACQSAAMPTSVRPWAKDRV